MAKKRRRRSVPESVPPERLGGHPLGGHRRGRPSQLIRACLFRGLSIKDVVVDEKGDYSSRLWGQISGRNTAIAWPTWVRIAKALRVAPWTLCEMPPIGNLCDHEIEFARRLEYLLENELIPSYAKGEPVEITQYVWQMQDYELDRIPITFVQQARALRTLCSNDRALLIETWSTKTDTSLLVPRIGAMYRAPHGLLEIDCILTARAALDAGAWRRLTKLSNQIDAAFMKSVKKRWAENLITYRHAVADGGARSYEAWSDIERVVNADAACRGSIYPPGNPLKHFQKLYAPSQSLINRWWRLQRPDFYQRWPALIVDNSNELDQIDLILQELPLSEEREIKARRLAEQTINRTMANYKRLATAFGLDDPVPAGEVDPQMVRSFP